MTGLARAAAWALDLLYPRSCAGCGAPFAAGRRETFCPACEDVFPWIVPPFCLRCGDPFEVPAPEDLPRFLNRECADCRDDPPAFELARAAFRFEGPVRKAVHAFKFEGRRELAEPLAVLLHRALREVSGMLDGVDAVVPVPLHPRRRRSRGYNQAEALAVPLARLTGMTCLPGALARTRETPPQVGLHRAARKANVAGAFAAPDAPLVAGRRLLLVDDVVTTDATVNEAAKALRAAGAASVHVASLARG